MPSAITLERVTKKFRLGAGSWLKAADNVSLELAPGVVITWLCGERVADYRCRVDDRPGKLPGSR